MEVLVIDNGSSDDTSSVATSFCTALPIRLIREESPGLSNARNRAVQEAQGDWILWTDDDVTVSKQWLNAYVDAISRHPDASVLGGPIAVCLEGSPPAWLSAGVHWILDAYAGRFDTDFRGQFFAKGPKPYGANFALQRAVAREFPFDPALGHHPLRPTMGGEETAVIASMLTNCGKGWWVPEGQVTHHIDGTRQSIGYLRSYYVAAGCLGTRDGDGRSFSRLLIHLSKSLARASVNELRYFALCMSGEQDHRVRRLRDAAWHWGYVKGYTRELGVMLAGRFEERRSA